MSYRRADGIAFILSAVIYCFFCFIMPAIYPDILKESGKTIEVLITPGMSAQNAAAAIEKAGIIDDTPLPKDTPMGRSLKKGDAQNA